MTEQKVAYVTRPDCTASFALPGSSRVGCDDFAGHGGPHQFTWWDGDAGAVPAVPASSADPEASS